jgi:hypothetical protein
MLSCELPLCNSESLLCCLLFCNMLLVSEAYPPGSDLITVPKALPLDDVNVTSLDWCSSEVLSVDPDPDPVEDFLNRFLKAAFTHRPNGKVQHEIPFAARGQGARRGRQRLSRAPVGTPI